MPGKKATSKKPQLNKVKAKSSNKPNPKISPVEKVKTTKKSVADKKPTKSKSAYKPRPKQKRSYFSSALMYIKNIPSNILAWIKHRPLAIRNWRTERKKRKMYRSFHLQKKLKSIHKPIPSSWKIFKNSWRFLVQNRGKMLLLVVLYGLIYFVFLAPKTSATLNDLAPAIDKSIGESSGISGAMMKAGTTIGLGLLSSGASSSSNVLFGLMMSLIFIWAIRHLVNKRRINIRDAIYQGPGPFIPFVTILFVITIECIPAFIMSYLYSTAKSANLLTTGVENFVFFSILAVVILLCFYWATASIIALYISTLPGMYPIKALRSAKKLVAFRRFEVFRRIVALPIWLFLVYGLILIIMVFTKPDWIIVVINIMAIITLPLFHTYMYKVYRALL